MPVQSAIKVDNPNNLVSPVKDSDGLAFEDENFRDLLRLSKHWNFTAVRTVEETCSVEGTVSARDYLESEVRGARKLETVISEADAKVLEKVPLISDLKPVIVILGPVLYSLAYLQEGARLAPGEVFISFHPRWISSQYVAPDRKNLYLKQGVCAELDPTDPSKTTLVFKHFKPARPIGYFINYMSPSSWSYSEYPNVHPLCVFARDFEMDFVGALSSSTYLEPHINDKIFTRCLLTNQKVAVPDWVAIRVKRQGRGSNSEHFSRVKNELLASYDSRICYLTDEIRKNLESDGTKFCEEALQKFISLYPNHNEVVIKPSGTRFLSCVGVKICSIQNYKNDPTGELGKAELQVCIQHLQELMKECVGEDGILIDGRLFVAPIILDSPPTAGGNQESSTPTKYDWVLRVVCSRSSKKMILKQKTRDEEGRTLEIESEGVTAGAVARVGKWGGPVNASTMGGFWAQVERAFDRANLDVETSMRQLEELGPAFFKGWDTFETKWLETFEETPYPFYPQTDMVGLDVMMQKVGEDPVTGKSLAIPHVIEVNDHDCGGFDAWDCLNTVSKKGQLIRPFVQNALVRRDQIYLTNILNPRVSPLFYHSKEEIPRSKNPGLLTPTTEKKLNLLTLNENEWLDRYKTVFKENEALYNCQKI